MFAIQVVKATQIFTVSKLDKTSMEFAKIDDMAHDNLSQTNQHE